MTNRQPRDCASEIRPGSLFVIPAIPATYDLVTGNEDVTTMEMPSADVRTDTCNLRLSEVSPIESEPTRHVHWSSVAAPVLRRTGLADGG